MTITEPDVPEERTVRICATGGQGGETVDELLVKLLADMEAGLRGDMSGEPIGLLNHDPMGRSHRSAGDARSHP